MHIGTKLIRNELEILKRRVNQEPRKFIQIVHGPRHSGKTTLISQFTKRTSLPYHALSADDMYIEETWIKNQWETARLKLLQNPLREAILIIDEIQKIRNWGELVQKEWDADTHNKIPLKVILVCSSGSMLNQSLTESLQGRYETIYSGHWTFPEMNAAFGYSPEEYVWFGGYPGAATLKQDENQWRSFVHDSLIETSISRDIHMLTRIDKPMLMRKLFELGCQSSGQILSYNKIMGQLPDAGNTTTLAHYLHLLESGGLLTGLEKFSGGTIRQRASSPKFQVHNTALLSATQPESFSAIYDNPSRWGQWVESCVGAHLLNVCLKNQHSLQYWKHVNDEMSFMISDGNKIIGIEVNTAFKYRNSSVDEFMKTHRAEKVIRVGTEGITWQDFIKMDLKELL